MHKKMFGALIAIQGKDKEGKIASNAPFSLYKYNFEFFFQVIFEFFFFFLEMKRQF
jgi:hypothetical protein